jgi:hypothetical protein
LSLVVSLILEISMPMHSALEEHQCYQCTQRHSFSQAKTWIFLLYHLPWSGRKVWISCLHSMPKTFKTSKQREVAVALSGKMQWWMVDVIPRASPKSAEHSEFRVIAAHTEPLRKSTHFLHQYMSAFTMLPSVLLYKEGLYIFTQHSSKHWRGSLLNLAKTIEDMICHTTCLTNVRWTLIVLGHSAKCQEFGILRKTSKIEQDSTKWDSIVWRASWEKLGIIGSDWRVGKNRDLSGSRFLPIIPNNSRLRNYWELSGVSFGNLFWW